ncbi:hypothetical protein ALC57_05852 [Trachymyrmex cornetzi]|uniref:Uncharacterized protein n=1 Tax=Trachymyrmex cornetzi TaxID=471704 RepID=A0A151J9M8_9HYME|nr:hypothetical protein ALC57_05852 [Trachymyrmex cornetzi]
MILQTIRYESGNDTIEHSLEKSFTMIMPTFVNLQGYIIGKKFVVKEVAILRRGAILSHYIFTCSMPWSFLTKSENYCASWLSAYHHGLQWEDGTKPYSMVKRLITMAVIGAEEYDDNKTLVYVKGHEKREWLNDVLDSDNLTTETLNANYKDTDTLHNVDVTNTMRFVKHIKNCALQNVFKIYNWWSQRQKEIMDRRTVRLLSRRYDLTSTGYKYLEIGINVGPPSYVDITLGDYRGPELSLSLETWKGLNEQRWNIYKMLRKEYKDNFISVGPLTVRVCTLQNNATLVRLDSSPVRMMMTETTLHRMFEFDGCIDVTFERLVRLVDTVDAKYTRFSNIASKNAIRDSDIFNEHRLVDCELLALIF